MINRLDGGWPPPGPPLPDNGRTLNEMVDGVMENFKCDAMPVYGKPFIAPAAGAALRELANSPSLGEAYAEYKAGVRKTRIRWGAALAAWVAWLIYQAVCIWITSQGG